VNSSKNKAPGPPAHGLLGHVREFRKDVLGLLLHSSRTYGSIIRFRLGPQVIHLINSTGGIEHVLQKQQQNYDKSTRSARFIRGVCGESLLSSNGPAWQSQRRLLQPFFHRQSVQRFANVMAEATQTMLESWHTQARGGQPLDVASAMMQLTYRIAARSFFTADAGEEARAIEQAMQVILPHTFDQLKAILPLPAWVPTPQNRRFSGALRTIDRVVYRLIEQHRQDPSPRPDLLGMLLMAADEQTGKRLSDRAIRDQTITFLLAGHETTSNALTWTFYLLAAHPEAQAKVRAEAGAVLGGRPVALEDLTKLPLVRQVVREAMRLYPPIWIIERRVLREDVIEDVSLPRGSAVVVCPYTLHRHPAFWPNPDAFQPERFADTSPSAYIPFGAGPRYCIGSEYAMLEAQIVTAMVVQAFRMSLVPGIQIEPEPGITLRTRHGLPMRLQAV
jgi:cytochrome P450